MSESETRVSYKEFHLHWQLLPFIPLIAFVLLLIATLLTLNTFGLDIGRHVETGSTFGFQGPSYFYVTGLFSAIITIILFFYFFARIRYVNIKWYEEKVHLLDIHVFPRRTRVNHGEVRALLFRRFPSSSMICKALVVTSYLAYILQLAVLNFNLPYIDGIPVTGLTLLAFVVLFASALLLGLLKPGLRVVLLCESRKIVFNFPGLLFPKRVISTFQEAFKGLVPITHPCKDKDEKRQFLYKVAFGISWLGFGIYQLTELLLVSSAAILNQASAWILILIGALMLLRLLNERHGLHRDMRIHPDVDLKTRAVSFKRDFWSGALVFAAAFLLFHSLGLSVASWAVAGSTSPIRIIYVAAVACGFLGFQAVLARLTGRIHVFSLDRKHLARISRFKIRILEDEKESRVKWFKQRINLFSLVLYIFSSVVLIASTIL